MAVLQNRPPAGTDTRSRQAGSASLGHRLGLRLFWSLVTVVAATFAVFALVDLAPGDAAERIAGPEADPELIQRVRDELRLDDPLLVRYGDWFLDVVRGDFGASLITQQPVTDMIARALPATVSLMVVTAVISTLVALAAGAATARRPDGVLDRAILTLTTVGLAVPTFWLGIVLVAVFSFGLGWFPAVEYAPLGEGLWPWLSHLILPAVALSSLLAAELTRQLRGSLGDVMRRDYILTGRMKGLGTARLIGKHALKNAAIPVMTVFGVRFAQLAGGTVVVEKVFAIRGLGSLIVDSVQGRDMPVVLGVVVVFTLLVIVVNVLIDASYGYFNPRLRA